MSALAWLRVGVVGLALALAGCQVSLPVRSPEEPVYIGADSAKLSSFTNLPWNESFEVITENRNHISGKKVGGAWQATVNRKEASLSYAANLIRQTSFSESGKKAGDKSTKEQILDWLEGRDTTWP